ncbi:MAG TPA: 6-carboxytetrahydropterin synthase QueD [Synergistales bacterium]|jgi:6-pyruvoyltetrahydropterin/6-carboxytetrahydropterin synthase|nr:6-carboxytetrahydropterin synthase QueD [Synergistales bacterium]MDI9393271.1 6-carboxytetrahydropterin synthase QueD [Synergistota bacterium]HRV71781.1 6-carboxytetrahydropterin synthase QueD [Thermovirgaceae bacterium]MDD3831026.1 6-carboxytetrahydropterin synthase QueD [Synergistales bacterium]MDD5515571.1 6-carboxytetrahydropterin synthase QueD [Synergistales bacterium]
MFLKKDFSFDAAHKLEKYHGKCEALHGHTYRFQVTLEGRPDSEGMIMDFIELKKIVGDRVLSRLDHSYLNEIIPQPTAENIGLWIWSELESEILRENCCLWSVQVWETPSSSIVIERKDIQVKGRHS